MQRTKPNSIVMYIETLSKSIIISTPTVDSDSPIWRLPTNIKILSVHVLCIGGTSIVGQLWRYDINGANGSSVDSSDITALTGINTDDENLSNSNISAGEYIGWKTTSVNGSPTRVIITLDYVIV